MQLPDFSPNQKSMGTSNTVVWAFYHNLGLIEKAMGNPVYEHDISNYAMMSIFMTVACVEAFVNVFFRERVEVDKHKDIRKTILEQMEDYRFGIDQKMRKWPELFFGKNVYGSKAGREFERYRLLRNALLHFKHTYEEIEIQPGICFIGVTDTTVVNNLDISFVLEGQKVARDVISEILKAAGCKGAQIPMNVQHWTGHVPQ